MTESIIELHLTSGEQSTLIFSIEKYLEGYRVLLESEDIPNFLKKRIKEMCKDAESLLKKVKEA